VISDFEEGNTGIVVPQASRQGWWYVFSDTAGGSQTPAANANGPIASAMLATSEQSTCNKWGMHSTATGHGSSSSYVGFGTSIAQILPPPASGQKTKNPYDVSAYDGITFKIKSGSGAAPKLWFELQNTETVPSPDGTAVNNMTDQYNTRGMLLSSSSPISAVTIGTSFTQVYVPFALLGPRYLPASTSSGCSNGSVFCEAPAWNPKSALGLQFSLYPQFDTTGSYDIWVDDVALYTGTNGLGTFTSSSGTAHPFPVDGAVGTCTKPTGATGKYLVNAYLRWKNTFVTGSGSSTRVQRPENANDTVSEGIAYGMLLAVYMGDKTLFDNLWSYWTGHIATGMLMTWCIPGGGGGTGSACSASGGSATDADEDAAWALIQAGKQWGGTYASTAASLISSIWTSDIDGSGTHLPKGGSNYGSPSSSVTNPSYFAPAYYRAFATIDTAHAWSSVITAVYSAIGSVGNSNGLIPAWCQNTCMAAGSNGASTDGDYQYDAHRVPWRIGLDVCWNGATQGKTFLSNNTTFFAGKATNGIGRVVDIYSLTGAVVTGTPGSVPNSMSAVGTAGVGAMASGGNSAFMNRAYRFILDATYTSDPSTQMSAYTYFNATVGLLTALTMSGNFNSF
jgi:endo-1,4-beta-D-glucanase Y